MATATAFTTRTRLGEKFSPLGEFMAAVARHGLRQVMDPRLEAAVGSDEQHGASQVTVGSQCRPSSPAGSYVLSNLMTCSAAWYPGQPLVWLQ